MHCDEVDVYSIIHLHNRYSLNMQKKELPLNSVPNSFKWNENC